MSRFVYRVEPKSDDIDLAGEFEPSLLNSAIYLLQLVQQVSTFAINYQGRPFREGIKENKGMYWGLIIPAAVAFSCATEFVPEINTHLKLVPFTSEFKFMITSVMLFDYIGCWVIEQGLKRVFMDFKPRDIALRRKDQLDAEEKRKQQEQADMDRQREEAEAKRAEELEKKRFGTAQAQ